MLLLELMVRVKIRRRLGYKMSGSPQLKIFLHPIVRESRGGGAERLGCFNIVIQTYGFLQLINRVDSDLDNGSLVDVSDTRLSVYRWVAVRRRVSVR